MKNSVFTKIALVLIVVMILGQIFGTFAIRHFFLKTEMEELTPQLSNIAEELSTNGRVFGEHKGSIIKVYDTDNKEVKLNTDIDIDDKESVVNENELYTELLNYIPKVLTGQNVTKIGKVNGLPNTTIMIGTPIVKNGQIIGTAFLMKPASDYKSALNGFYIVFFSVSLLSGVVILTIFALYLKANTQLEQTRRDYVANISHELRTPISSIKALTETLCDDMVKTEVDKERYYHIIHSESVRLERLISDMLELSRLQSGTLAFEKSYFSGEEMMNEIIDKFSVLADDMDIQFYISDNAKKLPTLFSNKDRIVQVMNILLDNAFKFCGDEGTVIIDATVTTKKIKISVSNSGEVIPKEDLPYVFDRFYKSEKSHSKGGSGLGLPIAKEILFNLNEELTVKSEQGENTVFTFTVHR